jgi:uncharacterized protein
MSKYIDFDLIDKYGPQELGETVSFTAEEIGRDEVSGLGDVRIDLKASQGDQPREYLVEGTVSLTGDLICSRCLEPLPFANNSSFTVRYRPRRAASEVLPDEEVEISGEELEVEYYSERRIPLREVAFEQIQLTVPMKPLCTESCRGLCPSCGANRNRATCSCNENLVDDRWSGLLAVRDDLSKKNES